MDLSDFAADVLASIDEEKDTGPLYGESPTPKEQHSDDDETYDLKQWAVLGSGQYKAVGTTVKKLPPGMWTYNFTPNGLIFIQRPINVDELLKFPNSVSEKVLHEISEFWTRAKYFKKYGFLHRRGYLFYGPQGGGKSCLVQLIVADIISRGGLVLICENNPANVDAVLQTFRVVEPDRPLICLFEDIDAIIKSYGEANLLSLLDGENQINTVINLATTNYPELLPKRIVSRPRRFDRIIKIENPNAEIRRVYFKERLKIKDVELDKWVEASDGWSFAACAELVISVKCLGNSWEDTLKALDAIKDGKYSSEEFREGPVGFGAATKT